MVVGRRLSDVGGRKTEDGRRKTAISRFCGQVSFNTIGTVLLICCEEIKGLKRGYCFLTLIPAPFVAQMLPMRSVCSVGTTDAPCSRN